MKKLLYIIIAVVLVSCAQVGTLSGGDKDITPPKLVKSTPKNGDTLFKETKIELTFNEYVELNNIAQQLIISPLVNPLPKAEIHGKTVVLTFDTLLRENTTYSLYFGDAIRDFTEKNVWAENHFVFSTGNVLDSLQIKGLIKNSKTQAAEGSMVVMLYEDLEDSAVSKKMPSYFAKTAKDGSFKINNIKSAKYRIFALQDMNNNYKFDLPNEKIAYSPHPINIEKNIDNIVLSAFTEDNRKQSLRTKKYLHQNAYTFAFAQKTKNATIEVLPKEALHHLNTFNKGDSVVVWMNKLKEDETIKIIAKDGQFIDTINFSSILSTQYKANLKTLSLQAKTNVFPQDTFKIVFNFPLKEVISSRIKIIQDSVVVPFSAQIKNGNLYLFPQGENNELLKIKIDSGGVVDIYEKSNKDSIYSSFVLFDESKVGQLLLKVEITDFPGPFVMQLISSKGEIVKEENITKNSSTFNYKNLAADEYKIKLLIDENKNGVWDSGNYYLHTQPERIIFYENPLTVRANWEMELQWNVKANSTNH